MHNKHMKLVTIFTDVFLRIFINVDNSNVISDKTNVDVTVHWTFIRLVSKVMILQHATLFHIQL